MSKKPDSPKLTTKKFTARQEREERQIKIALTVTGIVVGIVLLFVIYTLVNTFVIKPNTAVATVGDKKITAGNFDKSVRYRRYNLLNQMYQYFDNYTTFQSFAPDYAQQFLGIAQQNAVELNQGDTIGNQVLNDMIDDILIEEEAAKLGISVSKEELNTYIEENFGYFEDGTPTPANTATPFTMPTLSSQQETLVARPTEETEADETETQDGDAFTEDAVEETPLADATETVEEEVAAEPAQEPTATQIPTPTPSPTPFTRRLFEKDYRNFRNEMDKNGISRAQLERILSKALLRNKVMEFITKDVPAEEEQVWARHILVASLEEAEAIIERLNGGEDFASIAMELSTDEGSKMNGGDLGWFGRGRMVPEFENASFALENIGDVSEPVNSLHGWHIIQLLGKNTNPVDERTHETLKATFFRDWLTELRNNRDDIVINDNWVEFVPMKPAIAPNIYQSIMNPSGL
jgi:parvulin-like peptidyl-prolyl isomerase